jgi:DNA polymerase III, alpha subunit
MRKAFLLVKPKTLLDVAICLSIIRPAAKDAKKEFELGSMKNSTVIFDDDVIEILSKLIGCDEEMADKIRRGFTKKNKESIDIINRHIMTLPFERQKDTIKMLKNIRKYGFCKAHALSYAQLVWQLAYQKANYPVQFWNSTLKTVQSCYKKWVHHYEAKCYGVSNLNKRHKSIYAKKRNKNISCNDSIEQLKKFGTWSMHSDSFLKWCYYNEKKEFIYFKGIIASSKMLNYGKNRKIVLFVGVGKQHYIEVVIKGEFYFNNKKIIIEGKGNQLNALYNTIECDCDNIIFN